jgi:hypothetical protein
MASQQAGQPADSYIASPAHPGTGHPGHVIRREIFYIICCKKSSESSSNGQFVDKIHVIPPRSFRRFFIFRSLKQYHLQLYVLYMHKYNSTYQAFTFVIQNCNVGLCYFRI